ncbi:hypothetical protein D3C86_1960780 [compost metagenome]
MLKELSLGSFVLLMNLLTIPGITDAAIAFAESRLIPIPASFSTNPDEASCTTALPSTFPPLKASTRPPIFPDDNCCFSESKIEPEAA